MSETDRDHVHRAIGALVGVAVGDALGAPFEFKPGGTYRRRFPHPVIGGTGEMVGGATGRVPRVLGRQAAVPHRLRTRVDRRRPSPQTAAVGDRRRFGSGGSAPP